MNRNPMSRAILAAAVALSALPSAATTMVVKALPRANDIEAPTSKTVGSSRNGGHRGGNRAHQRAAMKKRNQQRHRKACRG